MRNGDGLRVVLWVAGCSHGCRDCHNPITWDPAGGLPFDRAAKEELFFELQKDHISGITLSGGDPLFPGNRTDVLELLKKIREILPEKNVWLYTGYTWEEICGLEALDYVDVLVDGRFVAEQKNTQLYWRGSSNQRVIDVKATKAAGDLVLHCE